MRSINIDVDEDIYIYKKTSGVTWRGLIIRGVESMRKSHSIFELEQENEDLKAKIGKMSSIIEAMRRKNGIS